MVARIDIGFDAAQMQGFERELTGAMHRFCRITIAPMRRAECIADFRSLVRRVQPKQRRRADDAIVIEPGDAPFESGARRRTWRYSDSGLPV